jgi:hypothetical protein
LGKTPFNLKQYYAQIKFGFEIMVGCIFKMILWFSRRLISGTQQNFGNIHDLALLKPTECHIPSTRRFFTHLLTYF